MRYSSCALLFAVAACHSAAPSSPEFRSDSPVLLSSPPAVAEGNVRIRPYWHFDDTSASVRATGYKSEISLTFPDQQQVLVVRPWRTTRGGGIPQYWLVGCVSSSGTFTLYRFTIEEQANGDILPTIGSKRKLFDSGPTPMYVTEIERIPDTRSVVMLDRRRQDIVLATDTDGSGFPDTIASRPFAEASRFPTLLDAQILIPTSTAEVRAILGSSSYDYITQRKLRETHQGYVERYIDTDTDSVADETSRFKIPDRAPLLSVQKLVHGQTTIELRGEKGRVTEVWKLGEDFKQDVRLAVCTMSGTWDVLTLDTALTSGQVIQVGYAGQTKTALQRTVVSAP